MTDSIQGQNILITGASGDIGSAIAARLIKAGAHPLLHYHKKQPQISSKVTLLKADLSQPNTAFELWQNAQQQVGRIHALINNAGIRSTIDLNAAMEDWQRVWLKEFQVNLFAAADLSKQAILHFKENGGGRIINMGSRAAQQGYLGDALPYAASKAALINLSKSIARSFAADGVIAIALAPGWVRTQMAEQAIGKQGQAAAEAGIPIGKMATPEEIADLMAFLLKPEQVSLNGATLDINGGSYIR